MLRHDADETTSTLSVSGLFVFIGATPSTVWLDGQLAVDKDGFVLREADIPVPQLESVEHSPLLLSRRVGPVSSASATTAADPSSGGDGRRRGLDGSPPGIRSPPGYRRRDHGTCRRQVASFASMRASGVRLNFGQARSVLCTRRLRYDAQQDVPQRPLIAFGERRHCGRSRIQARE